MRIAHTRCSWRALCALLAGLAACSSSHMDQWVPDPETLAAQRSARAEAQARAAEEAMRASELELAAREIEQSDGALDTAQLESVLVYHCGDCHQHRGAADQAIFDGLSSMNSRI